MPSQRILRAILFADIVGYTKLMQTDERRASTALKYFKDQVEASVASHQGEIAQFYGDGCLTTFPSATQALYCAMELQRGFKKLDDLSVRIGLHQGEVVQDEGNLYGDSINITSRIESMGSPGSILLSKTIRDQVKNKSEILLESMGDFQFKNVEETMRVYVVANDGYAVPQKVSRGGSQSSKTERLTKRKIKPLTWAAIALGLVGLIFLGRQLMGSSGSKDGESMTSIAKLDSPLTTEERNERILVLPFDNQTMSPDLESYGDMISDWLTSGLMATGEAQVLGGGRNGLAKQVNLETGNSNLQDATTAGVIIRGRYYLREDQLFIHSRVLNAATGDIIHAPEPLQGHRDDMVPLLDELTAKILGFWAVRDNSRLSVKPPSYKAYQKYSDAFELWSRDQDDEVEELLYQAHHEDPTFVAPLLQLAVLYGNLGPKNSASLRDSMITLIKDDALELTLWEKYRLSFIEARRDGDNFRCAQINEEMYDMDPSDMSANWNAGINYIFAGHIKRGADILQGADPRFLDHTFPLDRRADFVAPSRLKLGDYDEVIKIAKHYSRSRMMQWVASSHLKALIRMDEIDSLQHWVDHYTNRGIYQFTGAPVGDILLYTAICEEAYLSGKSDLLSHYLPLASKAKAGEGFERYLLSRLRWLEGDYNASASIVAKHSESIKSWAMRLAACHGVQGACRCQLGDREAAMQSLDALEDLLDGTGNRDGVIYYHQAVIHANCGETQKALEKLRASTIGSNRGHPQGWEDDVLLKDLMDMPEFSDLLKIKG